ncbi:MAG: sigma-70 family RNA polymerase sigma factor [Cyclobacteriaceae bacterium]|nr:sigma-70 family RNA polymerase sigma factor [Cyclobacteriaceae bacterium]
MMLETFKSEVLPLKNRLFRFAYSILGDHDLSKDVVQETMLKVWEKRNDLQIIQNLEAWCMTLTRNFALDKMRSKHHKTMALIENFDKENNEQSPYKMAELGNTMEVIDKIVGNLPLKQNETFQLRDIEGFSYQEISEITGYNINDVKVNIFRARKTIRTNLLKLNSYGLEKSKNAS